MAIAPIPPLTALPSPPPAVRIESGWVEGQREGAVTVWRGIPYAAAPVGDLRWRPPQPAAKFDGVRKAHAFGPACPQVAESPTQLSPLGPQSEDCLYLNVWAPASAAAGKRKLPVMVWLHGGGFIAGSGSEAQFDGATLARQGVILVTLNYRLGRLGFFAHPALAAEHPEEPHGNYGLLDQLAALRWVQANIAGFGGDPGNVTLFGESAGAISTVLLMTASQSKGLFHKAIVQSAPLGTPLPDATAAETLGTRWATSLGITGEQSATLAALRRLPADRIAPRSTSPAEIYAIMGMSRPMQDGMLLPGDPVAIFAAGRQMAVPTIVGSNGREDVVWSFDRGQPGLVPITALKAPEILARIADPGQREAVARHYRAKAPGDPEAADARLRSDAFAGASAHFLARSAKAGAWLYRFEAVPQQALKVITKAPHGTELFYTFGTLDAFPYQADRTAESDRHISDALVRYWAAFAKTGKPSAKDAPAWPAYDPQRPVRLRIGDGGPVAEPDGDAAVLDVLADAMRH
jgi:para-nitrobenzyl esterase